MLIVRYLEFLSGKKMRNIAGLGFAIFLNLSSKDFWVEKNNQIATVIHGMGKKNPSLRSGLIQSI